MTENSTSSPKVEENSSAPVSPEAEIDFISIAEMEALIAGTDPDFVKQMEAFTPEGGPQDLNIELMDLDEILVEEADTSFKGKVRLFIKRTRIKIIIFITVFSANLTVFLQEGLPELLRNLKSGPGRLMQATSDGMREFSYWPAKKRMATFGLIFGVIVTVGFVFLAATRPLLPKRTELFISSLEESADSVHTYDPIKGVEPFYDSSRASQNLMSLEKIVVNIKHSSQSGPNPMAAFEFYVEGNSPDVMVEVKDREYEVRDLFQRNAEEMTFDQLETPEGKQLLLEKLRREVNRILTKGRLQKVFFKTVILKP